MNSIENLMFNGKTDEFPEISSSRYQLEQSSGQVLTDEVLRHNLKGPSKRPLFMQSRHSLMTYYSAANRASIPGSDTRRIYKYLTKTMYCFKGKLFAELASYIRFGFLRSS